MLGSYLNQSAESKRKNGTDDRGQPIYADAEIVSCRRQKKAQNVLTKDGQTIKVQYVYYLTTMVSEGDMLDDKIVMGVSEWNGLNGAVIGYKAVM
jgi:hypothetical protein